MFNYRLSIDGRTVKLKIVNQSPLISNIIFEASNGVEVLACSHPQILADVVSVRGHDRQKHDKIATKSFKSEAIAEREMKRIGVALEEFKTVMNARFASHHQPSQVEEADGFWDFLASLRNAEES